MDEQNPTAGDSGASTLDRIQAYLSGPEPESQTTEPAPEPQEAAPTEPEATVEPADDGQQSDEPQLSTSDLAKYLGLDENALDLDEDGSLKIKTKVDGKEGTAKLQDLIKSYQLQEHVDRKSREAAERERAIQARAAEVEQVAQARLQQVQQLASVASNELMREYQSINWEALRQADPGQYAALKADFQDRTAKLQNVFATVQQQGAQREAQISHVKQQMLAQETEKLPELIPEWKDREVAAKESRELMDWGLKIGYTADAIKRLNESTALDVATFRKAMLYDKLQGQKSEVENKVRTAPKLVKPGQPATDTKAQKLQNLKTSIQKSGGKRGIAEYLIATGRA